MAVPGRRRRLLPSYPKLAVLLAAVTLIYCEYGVYYRAYRDWPDDPTSSSDWPDESSSLLMLVADPQLQGYTGEPGWPVGSLTRWDSDRYLRTTFRWAWQKYGRGVDMVIFLGDLLDEGSIADNASYTEYASRFHSIYSTTSSTSSTSTSPTYIYLSGDNDVGGENGDPITEAKKARFRRFFSTNQRTPWARGLPAEIVATNALMARGDGSVATNETAAARTPANQETFRVAVSHLSVLTPPFGRFSQKVLESVQPDVIFSAHNHFGMSVSLNKESGRFSDNVTLFVQRGRWVQTLDFNLLEDRARKIISEITVPTCSYRMGEKEMAFGLARFDFKTGHLRYHNLWLPARFPCLFLYAIVLAGVAVLLWLGRRANRGRVGSGDGSRPVGSRRSSASSGCGDEYSKLI